MQIFQKIVNNLKEESKYKPQSQNKFYITLLNNKKFLLGYKVIDGWGGLPVSSTGYGLSLISTGFD